jgi:hypothetical protein
MRQAQMVGTLVLMILVAAPAKAFQLETAFTDGCHEQITLAALAEGGWPDGGRAPLVDEGQARLNANLPFAASGLDGWAASLLIGVRENDLHGVDIFDFANLAEVHQSERFQQEHCLRAPEDDDEVGDARALAACRAFILDEIALALGEGASVDLEATEQILVVLRHETRAIPVSRYAFHLGRALHAVQDSLTHTLRDGTTGAVQHVLNYVDPATAPDYSPERDGHPHQSHFDDCNDPDNAARVDRARELSTALVAALANGEGGRAGRLERASGLVDEVLKHDTRCTPANDWCGSIDELPVESCSQARGATAAALLALVLIPRRARPRHDLRDRSLS